MYTTYSVKVRLDCKKLGIKYVGEIFGRWISRHIVRLVDHVSNIHHLQSGPCQQKLTGELKEYLLS